MQEINVLIVDDEQEACENLQSILKDYIDEPINILGCANTTREAEEKIAALKPDAIFLDIEMPNENAFQFLERLESIPFEIIFVTAYDEYAIRAFKLNAVDYILKPISISELKKGIEKLKERVTYRRIMNSNAKAYGALAQQINTRKKQAQLILRENNNWEAIPFKNITYLKAMGSYSNLYYLQDGVEKCTLMSRAISEYEEVLPPEMFFRIHRSYLINCDHVQKITKGELPAVILKDNMELPVSRRRFTQLVGFLKNYKADA